MKILILQMNYLTHVKPFPVYFASKSLAAARKVNNNKERTKTGGRKKIRDKYTNNSNKSGENKNCNLKNNTCVTDKQKREGNSHKKYHSSKVQSLLRLK